MANFCINCGSRVGKEDNFCTNCGTRIDKTDSMEKAKARKELKRVTGGRLSYNKNFIKMLHYYSLDIDAGNAIIQQVEKEIASGQIKVGGVEYRVSQLMPEYKSKMETEKKKLKMIDEIFESAEIQSRIKECDIGESQINSIKDNLKGKIIDERENMSEYEIRNFIKSELKKMNRAQREARIAEEEARIAREKARIDKEREIQRKIENGEGGYCSLSCAYCYEEYFDGSGSIVGDFTSEGYAEYRCSLGHSASQGEFCEYYR